MLHIVLLDEMTEHLALMRAMLSDCLSELGEEAEYRDAATAEQACALARDIGHPSVWFLDIELGTRENGIDAARRIHELDPDGYIVYVSAYQQYAMDCLHSHVFDFLSKPVSEAELSACLKALLRETRKAPAAEGRKLSFPAGSREYRIAERDIVLIQSKRNFCEMVAGGQFFRWKEPLKGMMERLGSQRLCQVSRKAVVNLDRVASVDWTDRQLTMDDGETVSFSRSALPGLRERLKGAEP